MVIAPPTRNGFTGISWDFMVFDGHVLGYSPDSYA
jgi:hypothetical protein